MLFAIKASPRTHVSQLKKPYSTPNMQFIIIVSILVVAAGVALAKPYPPARNIELQQALNNTVCPIVVEVDEDEDRIPRKIKTMKCAPQPNKYCIEQHIPKHECCEHSHNHHVMECMELHDMVLVFYPRSNRTRSYDVAVGCTCIISPSTPADVLPNNSR